MQERIDQELRLLRERFKEVEYQPEGRWVKVSPYPLPEGWNLSSTEVVFQIPAAYPGGHPYGIYTPVGLRFQGAPPNDYREPAPAQPPFSGTWGIFSWDPVDHSQWKPTADIHTGPNLLNWVLGFGERFRQGK
ncbi:MAG: hypothetical protein HY435_03250 [Candidatus Liptonbacteria bacterium]|nr:hypothetical protein [Candidatus Liptonbacteria bacterium]